MADGRLKAYLGEGIIGDRPETPDIPAGCLAFWYDTTAKELSCYNVATLAWETLGVNGIPGGTTHQVLVKVSDTDNDYAWQDPEAGLPTGGTNGQVLTHGAGDAYDWEDLPAIPSGLPDGGVTGQVLAKASDADDDVEWVNQTGGGGGGGGTGVGGRIAIDLGVLRPMSDFTPYNIGSTISLSENPGKAITVKDSAPTASITQIAGLYRPVPAASPYRVSIYVQPNFGHFQYAGAAWGFTDGAGKIELLGIQGGSQSFDHAVFSGPTTRDSLTAISMAAPHLGQGFWVGLRDDGENVYFEISTDGANYTPLWKQAKAGGYLGATGYTNIWFGLYDLAYSLNGADHPLSVSFLDYDEHGLTRKPGGANALGSDRPWYWDPPHSTDWALTLGNPISMTEDSDVGLIVESDGPYSETWARGNLCPVGVDWRVTMRFEGTAMIDHYANFGICVWEPVSQRNFIWGLDFRNTGPLLHLFRQNPTGYDGYETLPGIAIAPKWFRLSYNYAADSFHCEFSYEGKVWLDGVTYTGVMASANFNGNRPYAVGPCVSLGSHPHHAAYSIQYYKLE